MAAEALNPALHMSKAADYYNDLTDWANWEVVP